MSSGAKNNQTADFHARVVSGISAIDAQSWDRCAVPDQKAAHPENPFLTHAFLLALESSGSVSESRGWYPHHIVIEDRHGTVFACMPCYLKSHSRGEYIFDQGWADAFMRAGGQYYPKLLSAIPFTPVTGRRLLVSPSADTDFMEAALISAALQMVEQHKLSSFHLNFVTCNEARSLHKYGFLQRRDQQFHWHNHGYNNFDEFLLSLSSRKRKAIKKERRIAVTDDIEIYWLTGSDIKRSHLDDFFKFYLDTGERKWGTPYLTREFFSTVADNMREHILLIMCSRAGRNIAGALNFIGTHTLYGRYWGCIEDHKCLHFETCYYQAMEYAIMHGLSKVEAGAQGPHKLARGYLPQTTCSAHHIADPGFHSAIARYLENERSHVDFERDMLSAHSPFRKDKL